VRFGHLVVVSPRYHVCERSPNSRDP
jgi:hypothetical protein